MRGWTCEQCGQAIAPGSRINYGDRYFCPRCTYEAAPENSPVRWQMEHNYPDEIKKPAEKASYKKLSTLSTVYSGEACEAN